MRGRFWMLALSVVLGVLAVVLLVTPLGVRAGTPAAAPIGQFEVVDTAIVQRALEVAISPNGRYLYVLQASVTTPEYTQGNLVVLDAQTLEPVTTVTLPKAFPSDMAFSPDGAQLYIVMCSRGGGVILNVDYLVVVDTATYTISTQKAFNSSWSLSSLAVHPDGRRVYLTFRNPDQLVRVYDVVSDTFKSLAVGNDPIGIAVTPDGSRVYTAKRNSADVSIIDATSDTLLTTTLPLKTPVGGSTTYVDITPDGRKTYVVNDTYYSGGSWIPQPWISVINTDPLDPEFHTVEVITTTGDLLTHLSVSADGRYLYAPSRNTNEVLILDTATDVVRQQLPVAAGPTGVVASTRWGEFYVASYDSNTVSRVEMVKARLYLPLVLRNKS